MVITRFRAPRIARRAQKPKDGRRDEGAEHAVSELSRGFISEPYRKQTLSCGDNGGTASSSPFCHRSSHPPCLPTIKPCFLRDLSTDVPMVLINEKLHLLRAARFSFPRIRERDDASHRVDRSESILPDGRQRVIKGDNCYAWESLLSAGAPRSCIVWRDHAALITVKWCRAFKYIPPSLNLSRV